MISYAQNREDVVLERAFRSRASGFYVDVGAAHPLHHSVTRHFYEKGWRGINVEPSAGFFAVLAAERPGDLNLNLGLSNAEGEMTLFEIPSCPGLTTLSAEEAAAHARAGYEVVERRVAVTTLRRVFEEHRVGEIDFLSIDVEGHEREVIEGGDWRRWRPRVVLVEATRPGTQIPAHERWEPLLLAADYRFALFDGLNRFYVRDEDRALLPVLAVPANVFDDYVPDVHRRRIAELEERLAAAERALARSPGRRLLSWIARASGPFGRRRRAAGPNRSPEDA